MQASVKGTAEVLGILPCTRDRSALRTWLQGELFRGDTK